jgi:hypothetical protein
MEDIMKPTTLAIATGAVLAGLTFGAPVSAQSARIAVGAVFCAGPQYPPQARYPGRESQEGYGGYRGRGAGEYALNRGFNDGYKQGYDAARDRDRYDPWRERWYRDAERGYDRDYRMSRNVYRDVYRRGFLEGYESGYRDAQRGWRGGYGGYGRDGYYRPQRDGRPTHGGWW